MTELPGRIVFVLGLGRSGTTFIAKLIDSSPNVLYRHEPDAVLGKSVPVMLNGRDLDAHLAGARAFVLDMAGCREARAACHRPIFAKGYRGRGANLAFPALTMAAKLARRYRLPLLRRMPDLIRKDGGEVVTLIKSVSSLGRVRLFDLAWPGMKHVHIVRHPCAVHASLEVGIEKGVMAPKIYLNSLFSLDEAANYPFSLESISAASFEEKVAYRWMILNDKAANDMAATPGYLRIRYEDLCADVDKVAARLFRHLGLDMDGQTRRFIQSISRDGGSEAKSGYFKIERPVTSAVDKWKARLKPETVERIRAVVRHSALGRAYFDEAEPAAVRRPAVVMPTGA